MRERAHVDAHAVAEVPPPPARGAVEKKINYSNLNKVFWPAEKYTKGQLIEYYKTVRKWLLLFNVEIPDPASHGFRLLHVTPEPFEKTDERYWLYAPLQ